MSSLAPAGSARKYSTGLPVWRAMCSRVGSDGLVRPVSIR